MPVEGLTEDELKAVLEEIIPKHPEVKVWNLSLSSDSECDEVEFSDLAIYLDELQDRYDVLFVIAAGNINKSPLRGWPAQNYSDDKVSSPGDSVRALTVGSLAHADNSSTAVKKEQPSPFSRRGPGPAFVPKPEIVHYGGNCDHRGNCSQSGILSLDGSGMLAEDIGTSFSTPIISSLAAGIFNAVPEISRQLVKALIIHSAAVSRQKISSEDLRYFGFGVPSDLDEILGFYDWAATALFEIDITPGIEFSRIIPIPVHEK